MRKTGVNTTDRKVETGRFTLGRESFGKISAVEGLVMPKSMRGEFQALDRQKASARKRRETLSGKYGK
jgi:hypothetical protein